MMKGKKTPENGKRTSKKVLGLFDGSLIIKTLNHASKKKQTQRKTREFIQKHANTTSPHSKYSPGKIDALKDFDHLQFIPTVELTREQVENLVKTSSELHQTFGKFGAVKIRLPKDCEPLPLDLHKTKRKLTIRQQELPMLPKGKTFVNIKDAYGYQEFKDFAKEIERDFTFETPECAESSHAYLREEREYWGIVYGKIEKELREDEEGFTVEYAADLSLDQFADIDHCAEKQIGRLALNKIYSQEDSLFQISKNKTEAISGLVVPWVYVASKYATFCWHTEDLFLYSINYMHEGGCKIWYIVPIEDVEKVRKLMVREHAAELLKRPGLLDEVVLGFSPLLLTKENIRVYKVYQEPGDLILTFPGAYHCGFSPNFNVCEAVNIACADWLPSAKKHLHMNAAEGHPRKSCFSLEWMVSENRRKIERLDFTKEAADSLDAFYREMVKEEIEARRGMRARTEEEGILSDKSLKFWDLLCVGCRQYCYLTCMGCDVCFKIWCVRCQVECHCENRKLKMFVRFTDSELVNC